MSENIASLLDKAKVMHRLPSDYKLALVMGVKLTTLTNYRTGKTLPDARVIGLICGLTGNDPALMAAQVEAERAKTKEARALWLEVVARLKTTLHAAIFSVLFGGAFLGGFSNEAQAGAGPFAHAQKIYIVEYGRRCAAHAARWLARLVRYLRAALHHVHRTETPAAA